jgi:hypothetical protein
VIKSERRGWVVHVNRRGKLKRAQRILVGHPEGKYHWEGLGEDNIKMDITVMEFWVWIEFIWLRRSSGGLSFVYGNQFSGSIKYGEFLRYLNVSYYQLHEGRCSTE